MVIKAYVNNNSITTNCQDYLGKYWLKVKKRGYFHSFLCNDVSDVFSLHSFIKWFFCLNCLGVIPLNRLNKEE